MREAKRIIRALGDVDDRYIEEAAPGKKNRTHLSYRKLAVLVACFVLMLSLSIVAYAANWFGLRDLLLPFINRSSSIEEESSTIGLSGYQGSKEWQALAEWREFVSQYDPDGRIYQNIDGRLDSSFARYSCYLVYSQEMAEEIDRITEKYGLALHTTSYDLQEHPELIETLGDFLGDNGGYYTYMYEDGTFEVEGTIQLADTGAWDFVLLRSVKGTFHDAMLDIGDIAEYQEMLYETECGVPVTLALGKSRALVLADLEDCFVTITIPYGTEKGLGQSHLKILADSIDFAALTPVVKPQSDLSNSSGSVEHDEVVKDGSEVAVEYDADARQIYAATLRNLLYNNILPDGSTAETSVGEYSSFAISDVDSDGKEELVLLYDPGVMADEKGYIMGYDSDTGETYIQLEEFPYFAFLRNGNLKALSSHNQTYGDMWPYLFYRYIPESDTYELVGYVHSEDKQVLELNGMSDQYPYKADTSETGTVYYVGTDGWGTTPMDETDYMEWLNANEGNVQELEIPYLPFTEENIGKMELQKKNMSGNSIDTSRLLDECENMKVHWESDSIDVDGNGITDYAIVGTINEGDEYRNILGVMLDDGKTVVSEFQGVTGWREDFITVRTDKLRYTDKDSFVIQFTESTSNYGSSDIHILSVNADANEVEIIEEITILDGGINSQFYSLYEKTAMIGDMTVISMTPEDELILYIEKLGTNAVSISGNNYEKTQYLYWTGEKWQVSE